MEFQRFTAGGIAYGKKNTKSIEYERGITNVNFEDETLWLHLDD
jgi:hypothetical protein